jgi:hypothetical protein
MKRRALLALSLVNLAVTSACSGKVDLGDFTGDGGQSPALDATAGDGSGLYDAGQRIGDAGHSVGDAGHPVYDSGIPYGDAGYPVYDSGVPYDDAGYPVYDSGIWYDDAGYPVYDSGIPYDDAGYPVYDSGYPVYDSGIPFGDAGYPNDAAGISCAVFGASCSCDNVTGGVSYDVVCEQSGVCTCYRDGGVSGTNALNAYCPYQPATIYQACGFPSP